MERLSNDGFPKAEYDVVIIGSGYGGAIAASRIARVIPKPGERKPTVCILERGREWALGEFPDTPREAAENMQVDLPGEHTGDPLALFDFRVNKEMNVLVGCGLGGTSLINANVSINPDPRVFQDARWPQAIRDEFGRDSALTRGYNHALEMLRPEPYPDGTYAPLKKLHTLLQAAEKTKLGQGYRPHINVNFRDQVNHVGVFQPECNRCGDCVSGCNTGAKNTLMMNYLPDAKRRGAEIFTEVAVRFVEREEDGWTVHYQPVGVGRELFDAPEMFVRARVVILAAGSLGSTEILLRSRAKGLRVSDRVGKGFTGNGDVLGFGYNNDTPINGVGCGPAAPAKNAAPGPCITGIIDARATANLDDGFVIEEGSIPGALGTMIPAALALGARFGGRDTDGGVRDLLQERLREADSLLRGPRAGAVHHTQTYLVMAHDQSDGAMELQDDRLRISWEGVGNRPIFHRINQELERCTGAHGGTYVKSPTWSRTFGHDLVTVHPLGGCAMGDDATKGAVNHASQVFSDTRGDAVHDGLLVMDGAVLSRSVGVNPLITISALAERSCELLARARGWEIDYALLAAQEGKEDRVALERRRAGVRFTETMAGEFFADVTDPDPGVLRKRFGSGTPMRFTLTVNVPDIDLRSPENAVPGRLDGTVIAPALSPDALTATGGEFELFAELPDDRPEEKRMRYRLLMQTEDGETFAFEGNKFIHDDPGVDSWSDLTTLFVRVRRFDAAANVAGDVVGCALLKIAPAAFIQQMRTMAVTNARDAKQRLLTLVRFVKFFGSAVFQSFGGIFVPPQVVDDDAPVRKERALRAPAPQEHWFDTADKVRLRLTRYQGGVKGPVMLSHGLGVSSRIFAIDTIETNLVEHLVAYGYDVWLLDYRASISLPAHRQQFSGDDVATHDYAAAIAEVRRITGKPSVQLVSHCFGATTTTMALLAGLQGVRSVVLSQVSLDVVAPPITRVKTGLHIPDVLKAMKIKSLDAAANEGEGWAARIYDRVLQAQPLQREERCRSATCHRITFMYAPLYEHDQLNDATHDVLHEMFGEASMRSFVHLGAICRAGKVVSLDERNIYEPHLDRLNLPITFISGEENACFLPESTRRTYDRLRSAFDRRNYRRHVIPDYGHIDCMFGKNASRDVFPYIVESLEAWQ
jgi:cholesterol oxidase